MGDADLRRVQVWQDALWRLSTTLYGEVPGFSYLEPKRHIPHIQDLDGLKAQTFGSVLACTTQALKDADLVSCRQGWSHAMGRQAVAGARDKDLSL